MVEAAHQASATEIIDHQTTTADVVEVAVEIYTTAVAVFQTNGLENGVIMVLNQRQAMGRAIIHQ